ncbi:MAG: enoyl-CoA hydratase-related protein [Polyangiaceae bacterium]|nr:enoyl-CoA hydratase-related protein [Polyangiaceae bacterium]
MEISPKILCERRKERGLLWITLNAPKGNIIDSEMMDALSAALDEHGCDPELKAIAFEGAGKHFSFGASVEEHRAEKAAGMLAKFHALFRKLFSLSVPTIAVVRGQCLGGGMELAAYCTWLFASLDAKFGQPEIKLSVIAPVASVLLPWKIGGAKALDLCVSGRTVDTMEAHRMGLVTAANGDPSALAEAFYAEHIASLSGSSLRFAERAARATLEPILSERLDAVERMYLDELMKTPDAVQGIERFLRKGQS